MGAGSPRGVRVVITILYTCAYLYLFWCAYVLVMALYRAHLDKRLHGLNRILASPVVVFGIVIDVFSNMIIAPVVFLDLPREWMVTQRLSRYIKTDTGWRAALAERICNGLLDAFDPTGDHC